MDYDNRKATDPNDRPGLDEAWDRETDRLAAEWGKAKRAAMIVLHDLAIQAAELVAELEAKREEISNEAATSGVAIYGEDFDTDWVLPDWNLASEGRELTDAFRELALENGAIVEIPKPPAQVG